MSEALNAIDEFKRNTLINLYNQCTSAQQDFFKRMYPEGPENMPEDKINWAIQQCERTVEKNKKRCQPEKNTEHNTPDLEDWKEQIGGPGS